MQAAIGELWKLQRCIACVVELVSWLGPHSLPLVVSYLFKCIQIEDSGNLESRISKRNGQGSSSANKVTSSDQQTASAQTFNPRLPLGVTSNPHAWAAAPSPT